MPSGKALLDGGTFTQTVVATNGSMATLSAPSPANFVHIKTALSKKHDRDPLKSRKDLLQAKLVQRMLDDCGLQHVADTQNEPTSV